MIRVAIVFFVGAVIMIAAVAVFYQLVGNGLQISTSVQDWGVFGDYFGGVAGTLLTFVSTLLIVYTIHQQGKQIAIAAQETLKRELLEHISKAEDEIERWLNKKLTKIADMQLVEFGDIVWGLIKPENVNRVELSAAIQRLLKLTCTYCGSLAIYKENINTHFIYQQHRQKAEDLVSFLEQNLKSLPQMAGPSIALCKKHLQG